MDIQLVPLQFLTIGLGLVGIGIGVSGIVFGMHFLVRAIKQLPDQLAEKLIEKLREEENRKLFERKSDPKSE